MANPDDFLYEYAVVRYVPRVDREEFINIGLIMMCKRQKWLKGKILISEKRIKAFDPMVNIECLRRQASLFTKNDVPASGIPTEEKYRWLTAVKSAVLQVSPSHPGIITGEPKPSTEVLDKEFSRIFEDMIVA